MLLLLFSLLGHIFQKLWLRPRLRNPGLAGASSNLARMPLLPALYTYLVATAGLANSTFCVCECVV